MGAKKKTERHATTGPVAQEMTRGAEMWNDRDGQDFALLEPFEVQCGRFGFRYSCEPEENGLGIVVHFGGMSSTVHIHGDENWIPETIRKLKEGNQTLETLDDTQLRPLAIIMGDCESFFTHFFRGVYEVDSALNHEIEGLREDLLDWTQLLDEERDRMARRIVHFMERLVEYANSRYLTIGVLFSEINGSALERYVGKHLAEFGFVHAGLLINDVAIVEWGISELGPHLSYPRIVNESAAGPLIKANLLRRESRSAVNYDPGQVSQNLAELVPQLEELINSFRELCRLNEADLRHLSKIMTDWNRNYSYSQFQRNCQHFLNEVMTVWPEMNVRQYFGPVLNEYLRRIGQGRATLAVPNQEPLLSGDSSPVFTSVTALEEFVTLQRHEAFNDEQKFLLGMFHTVLMTRESEENANAQEPTHLSQEQEPVAFDWIRFKNETSLALCSVILQV